MEDWVKYRCDDWQGFNRLPKDAQSTFEEIEKSVQKIKGKRKFNILLMGNACVGKTSTVENIVKMGRLHSDLELKMDPTDEMPGVWSFTKGDFTLNFIDTKQFLDTGGSYDSTFLMLMNDISSSRELVDVILYVDRADVYSMNATDLFVAKTITKLFGPKAWDRVVIVLTHFDALEEKTKDDFCYRRAVELFNWIVKGGDIKEDAVKGALRNRILFISNAEKCKEPSPDGDLERLIYKMAHVSRANVGPLKVKRTPPSGYTHFCERIWTACENEYFEINNVGNSKGQKGWKAIKIDQVSADVLAALKPEGWKTDHLPVSALQFIENCVKIFSEEANKANSTEGNASFTILVMGRGGVGKSSIANSIIGVEADVFPVNKTKGSQEIFIWSGSSSNFTLRIIEIPQFTHYGQVHPGYFKAIKLFSKLYTINALLYVDRLDEWKCDDLMYQTIAYIASFLGSRILNQALIVLTHSTSSLEGQIESLQGQIESRRKRIKSCMVHDAGGSIRMCGCKVEDYALEAVAVDRKYVPDKKSPEWMDALFKGLDKISRRASGLSSDVREMKYLQWMEPEPELSWSARNYLREHLEKVGVTICVRKNEPEMRQMNQDRIQGMYKRVLRRRR